MISRQGKLSGPALDARVAKLQDWYVHRRQGLIRILQAYYPYGALRLTPAEQLQGFYQMAPQDYIALIDRLNQQYRGLPDAMDRVNKDLALYLAHMIGLMITQGGA